MRISIRLLIPEKKGIARRLAEAVESAGGKVEEIRATRKLRGMSETTVLVNVVDERLYKPIIEALGQIPGVAVLSTPDIPTA